MIDSSVTQGGTELTAKKLCIQLHTELPWGNETEQIIPCNAFRPVFLVLKGLV